MTELERLLSQDDCCLVSVASIKKALEQEPCDAISREAVNMLYDKWRPKLATHVSEFGDALKMLPSVTPKAIECEDAISREDAIKVIGQTTSRYTLAKEKCGMGQVEWSDHLIKESDAIDGLNELPSVTPIQKTNYYGVKTVLLSEDNK